MIEELWSELLHFIETLVSPDWGALIAMIPLILAGLIGLFFVWILVRFMRAGPTRRGTGRVDARRTTPASTCRARHGRPSSAASARPRCCSGSCSAVRCSLIGVVLLADRAPVLGPRVHARVRRGRGHDPAAPGRRPPGPAARRPHARAVVPAAHRVDRVDGPVLRPGVRRPAARRRVPHARDLAAPVAAGLPARVPRRRDRRRDRTPPACPRARVPARRHSRSSPCSWSAGSSSRPGCCHRAARSAAMAARPRAVRPRASGAPGASGRAGDASAAAR